jgi:hypothetical protein
MTMRFTIALMVGLLLAPTRLQAQPGPSESALAEAKVRFQRGVELYNEGNVGAAGTEFQRAYELVPNFRILYNLGQVALEQHDYAGAHDLFTRYLQEGGAQVPQDRRDDLQRELARLTRRLGRLEIVVDEPGAEIAVDDVPVGVSPMRAPITVNVGRRRVQVSPVGAPAQSRLVEVPGGERRTVRFRVAEARTVAPVSPPSTPPVDVPRGHPEATGAWIATGVLALGAATAGTYAYVQSRELREQRTRFPASREQLDGLQRRARLGALVTDSLLGAAALMGAVSLYLSLDRPSTSMERPPILAVGWGWPGMVEVRSTF